MSVLALSDMTQFELSLPKSSRDAAQAIDNRFQSSRAMDFVTERTISAAFRL